MPGWELLGKEEKEAVDEIFDKSGGVLYRYGLDKLRGGIFRVDEFEKALAKRVGSEHALCLSSGTAALKACLLALGVKAGDEVITQSFTFVATVEAILDIGAVPVITEVDETLNMDPEDLKARITGKTKAIIPVHMLGAAANMDPIMALAEQHGIPVLEDSAQGLGATYGGKPLGTIGDMGIYSLDIGKVITTGEGGVIVTDDDGLHRKALEYSDHGHECDPSLPRGRDTRSMWGFNYKMTELQGAVGLAQLRKLETVIAAQRKNKKLLKDALTAAGFSFRSLPDPEGDAGDTLVFFLESEEQAERAAKRLLERGIGTKNLPDAVDWHYAGTWTHIFGETREKLERRWPKSTALVGRAVSIPIMVKTTAAQIAKQAEDIIAVVKEVQDG